ncbi:MAG: divergent polysaccharide deacetylase family protein [Rhodospirillales bacterium]|nr:divergent polysaccharide deacetylase family protein [Rhodospirillales bacterium]
MGIFTIVTLGLAVGVVRMFMLAGPVPSTGAMSFRTPERVETAESAETSKSAHEVASRINSQDHSLIEYQDEQQASSQAIRSRKTRTVGVEIVTPKIQPPSGGNEQTLPVAEVPPKTILQGVATAEVPPKIASLRGKIGEPVDIEDIPEPAIPLWRLNAVMLSEIPAGPQVAVVIDDAGVDRRRTRQVVGLPGPLTIAFLTYARRLEEQVKSAVAAGHEIMTHVPMEPNNADANPGKNALNVGLEPGEAKSRLVWALNRIPGHVGINNHMGSRYTRHEKGMQLVMAELRKRGLLFLDSRTSRDTVGAKLAKVYQVPHAVRNIFLDHDPKLESIRKQLDRLEKVAQKQGYAVAIGHPRDATIEALSQWLPILAEKGVVLVPISAIIARREGIPQALVKISKN